MKKSRKRIFFSVGVIAIMLFISIAVKSSYTNSFAKMENPMPTYGVENMDNQDASDRQEKEPAYLSIFKLIVNCNPFKQKRVQ